MAITLASATDRSPGSLDARARARHREIVRRGLHDVLRRAGVDVRHAGAQPRQLDASVVSWRVVPRAEQVDVSVELRVVISDDRGRMISIVTGRARVSAPAGELAALREHVLTEAVRGMARSLEAQLGRAVG